MATKTFVAVEAKRSGVVCTGVAVDQTDAKVLWDANLLIIVTNTSDTNNPTSIVIEEGGRTGVKSNYGYTNNEGGNIASGAVSACYGPFTDKMRWCDTSGYLNLTMGHVDAKIKVQCIILPVQKAEKDTK